MPEKSFYQYFFNIILIGPVGVGKSALLGRLVGQQHIPNLKSTVGIEYGSILFNVENTHIKLQVWDTGGAENQKNIVNGYVTGSKAIFLCYDISKHDSFINAKSRLTEIKKHFRNSPLIFLVGLKSDLSEQRQVSLEEAEAFKQQEDMHAFEEVSALANKNVQALFIKAAKMLSENFPNENEIVENDEAPETVINTLPAIPTISIIRIIFEKLGFIRLEKTDTNGSSINFKLDKLSDSSSTEKIINAIIKDMNLLQNQISAGGTTITNEGKSALFPRGVADLYEVIKSSCDEKDYLQILKAWYPILNDAINRGSGTIFRRYRITDQFYQKAFNRIKTHLEALNELPQCQSNRI